MAWTERTLEELRESSNHLFYEVWMLESVAKGLASGVSGHGPLHNALVESFVIHVRNVVVFYADKPRLDDVVAEDYSDNPSDWITERPALSAVLSRAKRRAGKEVAHLTYARLLVTPREKLWEFMRIVDEIRAVVAALLSSVSKDRLGSHWGPDLQVIEQHGASNPD